jgi:translation initiation factor 5B
MDDIDKLLAEVDAGGGAADGGKKKRRGGKKKTGEDAPADSKPVMDDAEALLAELGVEPDAGGGGKKKRRGGKKKGGKEDDEDDSAPAAAAPAAAPAPTPKAGKVSAAKAMMLKKKEDQERRRREEEERLKAEQEAAEAEAARKAAEEAEKARKREEKRLKVEELKRAGKYQTKKQKQKAQLARARLDAMRAAGMIVGPQQHEDDDDDDDEHDVASPVAEEAKVAALVPEKQATLVPEKQAIPSPIQEDAVEESWETAVEAAPETGGEDDWMSLLEQQEAGVPAAAAEPADAAVAEDDWMAIAGAALEKAAAEEEAAATAAVVEETDDSAASAAASSSAASGSTSRRKGAWAMDMAAGLSMEERIERSRERRKVRRDAAKAERSPDRLRSPICCVLGHVDTGKTSLLDKIRHTNVQGGEAGGITQQIGATYFPMEKLKLQTDKVNEDLKLDYRIPGLLVVDTPGHESFTNLRSRGSNLCDIAVLVVDIMHGLEPQTLESLEMLRRSRTPFVVALNKVDRMYGWEPNPGAPIRDTLSKQKSYSVNEFETRTRQTIAAFHEQGLNSALYYENDDFKRTVSLVPTSAVTGEGIPDLLMLITQLTQQLMSHRLMFMDYTQCTVLEVKGVDGLGTTIDVCLVNGELREGDEIVVCGMAGPIHTTIRALLTPPPAREIRVKADYTRNKRIEAAMGIKIAADGLDKAVAGTSLLVVHPDDEIEDLKKEVMEDLEEIIEGFGRESIGVHVQASTLGSLEALLHYLRSVTPPIPVASVALGPVHRRDVMQCAAMVERSPEHAIMLCFDVKVSPEARAEADSAGIRIFTADIIYHLTDSFEAHLEEVRSRKRAEAAEEVAFPCVCKIIEDFNRRAPIILGVDVEEGTLRVGTPLCCVVGVKADGVTPLVLELGRVSSIQRNRTEIDKARPGEPAVAVKIEGEPSQLAITFGRHFDKKNKLYSRITRKRIDLLKEQFRDDLTKEEWMCVKKLKTILGVD